MAGVIAQVTGGELRGDGSVLIFFVERTAELAIGTGTCLGGVCQVSLVLLRARIIRYQ